MDISNLYYGDEDDSEELKDGDALPPCPKCGRIDKHNVSYHTHDLDSIFGFGDEE